MIGENGLNVKSIKVSEHAIKRGKERVTNWDKLNDNQVIGNIRNILKRAELIGETVCEKGNTALLYASGRTGIYLKTNKSEVVTIIRHEHVTYEPLKNRLLELHKKEMRKLTRKESALKRKLNSLTLDCNVELAELKRRIHKTRSSKVKTQCEIRIGAIEKTMQEYREDIKMLQEEKRKVGKSLVAMV